MAFPSGSLASGRTVIRYLRSIRNWNMGTPRRNGKTPARQNNRFGAKKFQARSLSLKSVMARFIRAIHVFAAKPGGVPFTLSPPGRGQGEGVLL